MTYKDFLTNCFVDLDTLQNKLNEIYDINSYTI
jgi:hypothetical protein